MEIFSGFMIMGLLGVFYFIPTILGWRKKQGIAICILNLFLGWTLIGWVAALIWASLED